MKVVVGTLAVGAAVAIFLYSRNASAKQDDMKTVEIVRGTIVDKALAVGQIVPDQEIQVKSQISGIVARCFVEVGDRVEVGQPLFSITPDPTPLELADTGARRRAGAGRLRQGAAGPRAHAHVSSRGGILPRDQFDSRQKDFEQARISLEQAKDRLALLREGRIESGRDRRASTR